MRSQRGLLVFDFVCLAWILGGFITGPIWFAFLAMGAWFLGVVFVQVIRFLDGLDKHEVSS